MPELAVTKTDPNVYYRNYLQSYVERDVRQIANIGKRLVKTPHAHLLRKLLSDEGG